MKKNELLTGIHLFIWPALLIGGGGIFLLVQTAPSYVRAVGKVFLGQGCPSGLVGRDPAQAVVFFGTLPMLFFLLCVLSFIAGLACLYRWRLAPLLAQIVLTAFSMISAGMFVNAYLFVKKHYDSYARDGSACPVDHALWAVLLAVLVGMIFFFRYKDVRAYFSGRDSSGPGKRRDTDQRRESL